MLFACLLVSPCIPVSALLVGFGLGLEVEDEAVAQGRVGGLADVGEGDVVAPLHEGEELAGLGQLLVRALVGVAARDRGTVDELGLEGPRDRLGEGDALRDTAPAHDPLALQVSQALADPYQLEVQKKSFL